MSEGDFGKSLENANSSTDKLLKKFKELDGLVSRIDKKLQGLGTGGGNTSFKMGTDGATFGGLANSAANGIEGAAKSGADALKRIPHPAAVIGGFALEKAGQVAGAGVRAVGASFNMMPDVNATMTRMSQGYNFATMNGFSGANNEARAGMQRGTLAMMNGGLTGPGSDMQFANIMASSGISYSSDPNSTFAINARTTGNLAKYLNIDNGTAAQSMANLTSGPNSAALMRNMGIMTSDPMSGKKFAFKDIAAQFEQRVRKPGVKMTTEGIMDSYHRGFLGDSLRNSGFDEVQQQMILQDLMSKATTGKGIDFANNEQMDKLAKDNPMLAQYRMNNSDTNQMQKAEGAYKTGVDAAVSGLEVLNNVAGDLAATFGSLKSGVETFAGHRAGAGFIDVIKSIFPGNGGGGPQTMGTAFGSGGMSSISGVGGNYSSGGGGGGPKSTIVSGDTGGGTMGASSNAGVGPGGTGGTSTNAKSQSTNTRFKCIKPVKGGTVIADYGVRGSRWNGGIHKALDWTVPEGTPVVAAHDGVVHISDNLQSEVGRYIRLWYTGAGDDRTFSTGYAHLSRFAVPDKSRVKQGEIIAYSGRTGTNCDGPHLHFEVWKNGQRVNPHEYISGEASGATKAAAASGSGAGTSGGDSGTASTKNPLPVSLSSQQQVAFDRGNVTGTGKVDYYGGGGGTSSSIGVDPLSGGAYSAARAPGKDYLATGGGSSGQGHSSINGGSSGGSKAGVVINLTIGRATDGEAKKFAEKVKDYLQEDRLISNMGRS